MEFLLNPDELTRPLFAFLQSRRKNNKTQATLLTRNEIHRRMGSGRNTCHIIEINPFIEPSVNHTCTEHGLTRTAL